LSQIKSTSLLKSRSPFSFCLSFTAFSHPSMLTFSTVLFKISFDLMNQFMYLCGRASKGRQTLKTHTFLGGRKVITFFFRERTLYCCSLSYTKI